MISYWLNFIISNKSVVYADLVSFVLVLNLWCRYEILIKMLCQLRIRWKYKWISRLDTQHLKSFPFYHFKRLALRELDSFSLCLIVFEALKATFEQNIYWIHFLSIIFAQYLNEHKFDLRFNCMSFLNTLNWSILFGYSKSF